MLKTRRTNRKQRKSVQGGKKTDGDVGNQKQGDTAKLVLSERMVRFVADYSHALQPEAGLNQMHTRDDKKC